jgi:hypothetical protein
MLAEPFLNTGVMTADFQTSGTAATDRSCVKIADNGIAKQFFIRLNKTGGRPSGPLERLFFSFFIAVKTDASVKTTLSMKLLSSIYSDIMEQCYYR